MGGGIISGCLSERVIVFLEKEADSDGFFSAIITVLEEDTDSEDLSEEMLALFREMGGLPVENRDEETVKYLLSGFMEV